MLSWIASWWSSGTFTGPARNAPNEGKDIKALFDQKPSHVVVLTDVEIQTVQKGLKKIQTNATPPKIYKSPILQQIEDVAEQGHTKYFENIKKRREEARSKAKRGSSTTIVTTMIMTETFETSTKSNESAQSNSPPEVTFNAQEYKALMEHYDNGQPESNDNKSDAISNNSTDTNESVEFIITFTQEDVAAEANEFKDV